MTYPLINAARHILFFVPDPAKAAIVDGAIKGDARYPASQVHGAEQTTWLLGW